MIKGCIPLAAVLALAAPACSKDTTTPTTTASTPRTTDTFTGTVQIAGSDVHSFPVTQTGQVEATLTAAGPPSTIVMGSTKVMIGGMPAARMGDSTAHGGVITLGAPTVMIN